MKTARLKILILIFVIVNGTMMGNEITKLHNIPLDGDEFSRIRVSYIAPGDSGK